MIAVGSENEPFTSLADALALLEEAVSPLAGIVTRVTAFTGATDETRLPNATSEVASIRRLYGNASTPTGDGAHPDPLRARAAAIGEALERYSGLYVPTERLRLTTARALGPAAVPPSRFALFHPAQHDDPQFPFVPFTEDTETHFVEGISLGNGERAYLPAQLVFLCPPRAAAGQIGYATSSGLACAATFAEATLAALLELVERDAVMLAWRCRLSLPLLEWGGDAAMEELEGRYFRVPGLSYTVLDGSGFLDVPVAIGVLRGAPTSGAALAIGAGSAARPRDAWLKALSECFGVRGWLIVQSVLHPDRPPCSADAVETFEDHMLFYADGDHAELARFLDASTERTRIDDVPCLQGSAPHEQVDALVSRLFRRRVTAYAIDVTAPDVSELGLTVVRVVAPELCQLDVLHGARHLGGARLFEAAHEIGLLSEKPDLSDLNPLPHPFP